MGMHASLCISILLGILIASSRTAISFVGINWGTTSFNPLPPKAAVSMLQNNGITQVKLFDANNDILTKLAGTNIEVMVALRNEELSNIAYSQDNADNWVKTNVKPYMYEGGTQITYIAIGNEPYLPSLNGIYLDQVPAAMQSVLNSLNKFGLANQIKVVTPMNFDAVAPATVPSVAVFQPSLVLQMSRIIQLLEAQDAPFIVNIYPYLTAYFEKIKSGFDFDPAFLYFDGDGGKMKLYDNISNKTYTNLFDASYDTVVVAVEVLTTKNKPVEIMLGEIGWPTDGSGNTSLANIANAKRFNNGAIKHFLSSTGTPLRPHKQISGWLFALLDEDAKPTTGIGDFERHWGIFKYNGTPKYNLDLSGNNNPNAQLKPANGVYYLPLQWCASLPNAIDAELRAILNFACGKADCTSIQPGSSCYDNNSVTQLRNHANYAINNYYQENDQDEQACVFNGTAHVVTTDPSYDPADCPFRVALADARITGQLKADGNWSGTVPMLLLLLLLCLIVSTGK